MQFDKKRLWFLTIPLFYLPFILLAHGCGGTPEPSRNRVPTVQAQLDQAQKAANDAKGYADSAAQSQKNIQDALAKLDNAGRNSDGSVKIGHEEISGIGTVTEVGMTHVTTGQVTVGELYFTFAERAGFTKKFDIVCSNQAIPVNKMVVLNFHWHSYDSENNPGCYIIDSYTVVQ